MGKQNSISDEEGKENENAATIQDFVQKHGYSSFSDPYLSEFLTAGGKERFQNKRRNHANIRLHEETPCAQYLKYVHPDNIKPYSKRYDLQKVMEFKKCLSENYLPSGDVVPLSFFLYLPLFLLTSLLDAAFAVCTYK